MPYGIGNSFCRQRTSEIGAPLRTAHKALLPALLALSVISLFLTPPVTSQAYITITSKTTETGQVTTTSYGTSAIATQTLTSTITNTHDYSFTLPALPARDCDYDDVNGTFNAGDRLIGTVVTNGIMDFYVMSSDQFHQFTHGSCNRQFPALVAARKVISSYSLYWVVPADGVYYFVFFNYASWGSGTNQVIGSFSLEYPVSQSATLTLRTRTSQPTVLAITEISSSVYPSTIQMSPGPVLPMSLFVYLVIIVILEAIAIGTMISEKEMRFCVNCGAVLPLDSKSCNKCGSAQP
jgi:hypothetical protein